MLPEIGEDRRILKKGLSFIEYPTKTYALDFENRCVKGYADGLAAMEQAVRLIMHTERFLYEIYSWNYGIELAELFGQSLVLAEVNLKRNISDALLWDNRITAVTNFTVQKAKKKLTVAFTVQTKYGELSESAEVKI